MSKNNHDLLSWANGTFLLPEVGFPAGVVGFDLLGADSSAHRFGFSNNGAAEDFIVGEATVDTFTNKYFDTGGAGNQFFVAGVPITATLGSGSAVLAPALTGTGDAVMQTAPTIITPVISGTPTGTGIPTSALLHGGGGGSYTTTSVTYVVVDSTDLSASLTIPVGWKLLINVSGAMNPTYQNGYYVALADGISTSACTTLLQETEWFPSYASPEVNPFSLTYIYTGDGNAHNINLCFKTSSGSNPASIVNSSSTLAPMMSLVLTPSN
jgi:hypothetical protein